MWDEIEERLRQIENEQHERDGKCDDVRGEFARWLINKFLEDTAQV